MTWCSEYSAVPRCLLARSAIRCRSVDRFAGFSVPSRVSLQRLSLRGACLPSVGSQRARFPDFAGTMKALRLPPQVCPGPLWVRFQAPQAPLCSCSPKRSRGGRDPRPGLGLDQPGCPVRRSAWGPARDLTGFLAFHPRLLPGSQTPAGPAGPRRGGPASAAPGSNTPKAPAWT